MQSIVMQLSGIVIDYFLGATLLLAAAWGLSKCIAAPRRRMVLAWAVSGGLLWLAIAAALPSALRIPLSRYASVAASTERAPRDGVIAPTTLAPEPLPQSHTSRPPAVSPDATAVAAPPVAAPPASTRTPALSLWSRMPGWQTTLLASYLLGAVGILVWLIAGALRVHVVCRRARAADAHLEALLKDVIAGQGARPCLLIAQGLPSAAAVGVWNPQILLPEWMLRDADDENLRALFTHEWTHIRNRDLWLMALGRALFIVLYVHPLYWWLRRSIQVDQELLADAAATGVMSPAGYAEQLLQWTRAAAAEPRHRLTMSVGLWERPSQLSRRIHTLLDDGARVAVACSPRWKLGLSAVVALLAVGVSLLTVQPEATIAAEPQKQSPPKRDNAVEKTAATEPAPAKAAEPVLESGESYVIDGRVLGPDGQPFAGAKLYAIIKSAEDKPPQLRDPAQPPFELTERPGQAPLLKIVHPKLIAIFKKLGKDTTLAADDPFMRSQKVMPDLYKTHPAMSPPVRATSDADGRFRFELAKGEITGPLEQDVSVVAVAPNLGPAWNLSHEPGALSGLELRLAADLPIRGRIVDHGGKPIAGATVQLGPLIDSPERNVDFWKDLVQAYMDDLNPRHLPHNFNRLFEQALSYQFPGSRLNLFPREVVTDGDGRFTISGLGANRVVYKIEVTAPGAGGDTFSVATVNDFDLPLPKATQWGSARPEYRTYGATFEHQLRQQQIIEGTIRDAATGKPVPNVQVAAWSPTYVDTFTDAEGKYRLTGLSRAHGYMVTAWPWENPRSLQPYLNLSKRLDGTAANGPIVADFNLIRGTILRGTLTDPQGKPIARTQVFYGAYPEGGRLDETFYPGNPKFPAPKSGVIIAPFDIPAFEQAHTQTDDNGEFSLIVLPGKGVLGVFAGDQYAAAEQVQQDPELQQFSGTVPRLQGYRFNAIEPLDVPLDEAEIKREWTINLRPAPAPAEAEEPK
jgi:beta-lactamase regulating signal transducer with metallopeptidase domain/protocatechuate 3,4-dioxygenase beta subunit